MEQHFEGRRHKSKLLSIVRSARLASKMNKLEKETLKRITLKDFIPGITHQNWINLVDQLKLGILREMLEYEGHVSRFEIDKAKVFCTLYKIQIRERMALLELAVIKSFSKIYQEQEPTATATPLSSQAICCLRDTNVYRVLVRVLPFIRDDTMDAVNRTLLWL